MWDDKDSFYYYYSSKSKSFVKVQTTCGFAPLLLPGVSDERVAALIKYLEDPAKFKSAFPMPTVAMDYVTKACPSSSTNMWRRPTWTNTKCVLPLWPLEIYVLCRCDCAMPVLAPVAGAAAGADAFFSLSLSPSSLFTIWGLRNYGHVPGALAAADRLQQQTVEMVGKYYERWGTT